MQLSLLSGPHPPSTSHVHLLYSVMSELLSLEV